MGDQANPIGSRGVNLRAVREIENLWITLADGTRLAARMWLPDDAEASPVPVILEYLPYRKRDGTTGRDVLRHPYIAARGYAAIRVDMRGSGESDGLLEGEYLKQEQDDALEVIAWLSAQPWCDGAVGMIGISWGGFNGLQIAARQPPALKAIITVASTDDRYADDVHYMGGALLRENLTWGSTMFSHTTRPPDPLLAGDRWREIWMHRLENHPLLVAEWLEHQRRDAFWQHGSVCEDYSAIACAVYAVGGWDDAYTNAVPRLLAGLPGPRKGLIGPWAHGYPEFAAPGPAIGFLQEQLRWWDYWLKGLPTGIMNEPMLRVWMQDSVRPANLNPYRPGRWVAEPTWPPTDRHDHQLHLTPQGLQRAAAAETPMILCSPQTVGLRSGTWCPYGVLPDDPDDQREDDGKSLCFDTLPLGEGVDILGAPVLDLELSSDQPNALLVARLCDVQPDGASTRVSYGVLNLTHRDSHLEPTPLEPGKKYRIRLQLNDAAHAFPAGNRIRIALSTTYFPLLWPSPAVATLTLAAGPATLRLPERAARKLDAKLPEFAPAELAPGESRTVLRPAEHARTLSHDLATGEVTVTMRDDEGLVRLDGIDLVIGSSRHHEFRVRDGDPLSTRMETRWTKDMRRGDWRIHTATRIVMTSTAHAFRLVAELDAYEGDQRVYSRNWDQSIPRDLV